MTNVELDGVLKSIGKRCFRNCYEIAKKRGDSLTTNDLIHHDSDLRGTAKTGLNTRLSCIKRIFRAGKAERALQMSQI